MVLWLAVLPAMAQGQSNGSGDAVPSDWVIIAEFVLQRLLFLFVVLAVAWVLVKVMDYLKVSVTPEAMEVVLLPVVKEWRETVAEWKQQAAKTATPYDDVAANLASLPAELLIKALQEQGFNLTRVPGSDTVIESGSVQ